MARLFLEIVTPENVLVSQEVDMVVAPGSEGEFGVLPDHTHFLSGIIPGELRFDDGTTKESMAVTTGFAEVSNDKVSILVDAAEKLGGHKADYGDTAVTINAFSHVPITIILWLGDDELAPQGNIVFDANISDYLPTEDITVLCETITWRLINYLREA